MMRNLPRVKSMSFLSYCMSTNWRTTRRLVIVIVADEVFHRIIGEEVLELGGELGAARVLLWHITRVGCCARCMTLAMVKVLPLPVTPSSVWAR